MSFNDTLIFQVDTALKTLFNVGTAQRPYPAALQSSAGEAVSKALSPSQAKHSAGLMRVNHVGEVCAQGLYAGQMLAARSEQVRTFNAHAALEERDHLLWTAKRLADLNAKPSVLNPVWYSGSWALGALAGLLGDKTSLSFVRETEAQVEAHLHRHESLLPVNDGQSLAIVAQMKRDEQAHGEEAIVLGGAPLPAPLRVAMKASSKLMTKTAYYV